MTAANVRSNLAASFACFALLFATAAAFSGSALQAAPSRSRAERNNRTVFCARNVFAFFPVCLSKRKRFFFTGTAWNCFSRSLQGPIVPSDIVVHAGLTATAQFLTRGTPPRYHVSIGPYIARMLYFYMRRGTGSNAGALVYVRHEDCYVGQAARG